MDYDSVVKSLSDMDADDVVLVKTKETIPTFIESRKAGDRSKIVRSRIAKHYIMENYHFACRKWKGSLPGITGQNYFYAIELGGGDAGEPNERLRAPWAKLPCNGSDGLSRRLTHSGDCGTSLLGEIRYFILQQSR
jgi:hypothetical protein